MKILIFLFSLSVSLSAYAEPDQYDRELLTLPGAQECFLKVYQRGNRKSGSARTSNEASAWLVLKADKTLECLMWSRGQSDRVRWEGPPPENTIANVHTHSIGLFEYMSPPDIQNALKLQMPFYVIEQKGRFLYKADHRLDNGEIGIMVWKGHIKKLFKGLERVVTCELAVKQSTGTLSFSLDSGPVSDAVDIEGITLNVAHGWDDYHKMIQFTYLVESPQYPMHFVSAMSLNPDASNMRLMHMTDKFGDGRGYRVKCSLQSI